LKVGYFPKAFLQGVVSVDDKIPVCDPLFLGFGLKIELELLRDSAAHHLSFPLGPASLVSGFVHLPGVFNVINP